MFLAPSSSRASRSLAYNPTAKGISEQAWRLNTDTLLHGLRLAVSLGIKRLLVYGDSLLVVQQVNKEWDINKETMDAYVEEIRIHHPLVKIQNQLTTDAEASATVREVMMIEEDWRIQFIDFIKEFKLPLGVEAKSAQAACIIWRSKGFVLVGDNLYKRSASGNLMKCVTLEEGKDILREIHEAVCGNHAASRTLVKKAYRSGFFWLTAISDVEDLIRRCPGYQFFGKQAHIPAHNLITIPPS